ncbi:MAG: DUF4868 domain-containing protein [Ktedonobacteraceae bacterium]|nr:DUF4868 domain-containing protein [Ktedonobacteraceae bacterium]MBO0794544.1 DUF4868 domain-containing protein [Ktedonobacteraceae bacterium]
MLGGNTEPATVLATIFNLDVKTCNIAVCLASTVQSEEIPQYRYLNITQQLMDEFRSAIATGIERYKREWYKHELLLYDFSLDSVVQAHEIEYLDLSTTSGIVEQMAPLAAYQDIPTFQQDETTFTRGLSFYVAILQPTHGQPIYVLHKYTVKKLLSESTHFGVHMLSGQQVYGKVNEPIFLFDRLVDCVCQGDHMFILQKKNFYDIFRYSDDLKRNAQKILDIIAQKDLIHGFERFAEDCARDPAKLRKLKHISTQAYLNHLSIEDMKKVIRRNHLKIRVIKVDGKEKVHYEPERDRWELINLLSDAYLDSPMTTQTYQAQHKRPFPRPR